MEVLAVLLPDGQQVVPIAEVEGGQVVPAVAHVREVAEALVAEGDLGAEGRQVVEVEHQPDTISVGLRHVEGGRHPLGGRGRRPDGAPSQQAIALEGHEVVLRRGEAAASERGWRCYERGGDALGNPSVDDRPTTLLSPLVDTLPHRQVEGSRERREAV